MESLGNLGELYSVYIAHHNLSMFKIKKKKIKGKLSYYPNNTVFK